MRRAVLIELGRREATCTGPRIREAVAAAGARSMPHPYRKHRSGVLLVHIDDVDDVIAAAESDGQLVEVVDRDGNPVAAGGLLGLEATG
jgi:hypothetical protein